MNKEKWYVGLVLRRMVVAILIVIQFLALWHFAKLDTPIATTVSAINKVLSLVLTLYIISNREKGAYKLTWVFILLSFPVLGVLLYFFIALKPDKIKFARNVRKEESDSLEMFKIQESSMKDIDKQNDDFIGISKYLENFAGFPVCENTRSEYFSNGKDYFRRLIAEIDKAERYIFIEYFIIAEGQLWQDVFEVLKRKAKEGVLVRIMYDDVGSLLSLPRDFKEQMEKNNIECQVFNPFKPVISTVQNNRDHRKIVSIDGKVAFTGGVNLADEYVGKIERFGHWKDGGIALTGKAAWSFTLIFLQLWNIQKGSSEDYTKYYPWYTEECNIQTDGYVQPYADSPTDMENVGEHVYMQILNKAKKYVYIFTPYLIIDDSMVSSLILAAKSGVDVRIITPHKWDKWMVHQCTKSYYRDLIMGGVRIYEYTPGFIHSKVVVCDDQVATVGTINFDFRSLYLHFECGVLLNNASCVKYIKQDALDTLAISKEMKLEDCTNSVVGRLMHQLLRILAPLL